MEEAIAVGSNTGYHEITSDAFFAECPLSQKFDVVYLDGLHTFEQTLRDLMNTLSHVKHESVIIIDDIFPSTLAGSLPDLNEFKKVRNFAGQKGWAWMGDVYKLVLFVDSYMQSWSFRCDENYHGQLIMWQAPRARVRERLVANIGLSGYDRAILERESYRFMPHEQIIVEIRESRCPTTARD